MILLRPVSLISCSLAILPHCQLASIKSKKTIRARGLRPHNPHFAGVDMLGHPSPKYLQKCIIFWHVFCSLLCRSFWCLWPAKASKMNAEMDPETMKMVSCQPSPQRVKKKADFCHCFVCFLSISYIFLCCVGCRFRGYLKHFSKAAISKPDRKTQGSASKTTFSQNWQRWKKTKNTIKKRIKNRHGNKTPKRHYAGPIFPLFWIQKSWKMKSRALQKTSFEKHIKKKQKKDDFAIL